MKSAIATKEPMSDDVLFGCAMPAEAPTGDGSAEPASYGLVCFLWGLEPGVASLVAESDEGVGQRIYAGLMYDVATSLNYAGARYYDASIGRFLSQDAAFLALGDKRGFSGLRN